MLNVRIHTPDDVKIELTGHVSSGLDELFGMTDQEDTTVRELELAVWKFVLAFGNLLLCYLVARRCLAASLRCVKRIGLTTRDVHFRMEKGCWGRLQTTFGFIVFPLFAFRHEARSAMVTHTPAREEVIPLRGYTRSSELCLEWEIRLGSDHPFRLAQEELTYFTHGATKVEDNAIAAHMKVVNALLDRSWLYRPVAEVKEILRTRATRDLVNGEPILYFSTDAHAERRYVDETWDAAWKMANGIRIWCIDHETGRVIHIGGEYTWGDCRQVGKAFQWLIEEGLVPADGDYGDGLRAQLVFLADGMPWFEDHILPLFSAIVVILDAYHLLDRLGTYAAAIYGKGTAEAKRWYERAAQLVRGKSNPSPSKPRTRKGHKRGSPRKARGQKRLRELAPEKPHEEGQIAAKLQVLVAESDVDDANTDHVNARDGLCDYIEKNAYRINYSTYRFHGYSIGSGAMEAMHRTGAQVRLKVAGARWLEDTSQAVFNWRMLKLVGRWDEFWEQDNIAQRIRQVLPNRVSRSCAAAATSDASVLEAA